MPTLRQAPRVRCSGGACRGECRVHQHALRDGGAWGRQSGDESVLGRNPRVDGPIIVIVIVIWKWTWTWAWTWKRKWAHLLLLLLLIVIIFLLSHFRRRQPVDGRGGQRLVPRRELAGALLGVVRGLPRARRRSSPPPRATNARGPRLARRRRRVRSKGRRVPVRGPRLRTGRCTVLLMVSIM